MLLRAGIRHDATSRDGAVGEGPNKMAEPFLLFFRCLFDFGQGAGDALEGAVYIGIDILAQLAF